MRVGWLLLTTLITTFTAPDAARASAGDDPIVVTPGDGRGYVDTRVVDSGRPGSARSHETAAGVAADGRGAGVTCDYFKTYYAPSLPGGRMIDLGERDRWDHRGGTWWYQICSDGSRDVVLLPDGTDPNGPSAGVTPAVLAQRAYNRLRLPAPVARFNPARPTSLGLATQVNLRTWWWVDGWAAREQRTAAGAQWALVTAQPVRSEWDPGDGEPPVACAGPGRAWSADAASDCVSVYRRSSAGQPGSVFTASVTVAWRVTWRGAGGASGVLPEIGLTTSFPVAVTERESVVVDVGGGQ